MVRPPLLLRRLYPGVFWNFPTKEKVLYLTFDDGPIPEVTPLVLELLAQYKAKATFFCIGENVKNHPDVYASLLANGHAVGNHTFHHYNSWKVNIHTYLNDVEEASKHIKSVLFRPPYGKLTWKTLLTLRIKYRIIMWDVISHDYDPKTPKEKVLSNVIYNATGGSVIVFHDSLKAKDNLLYALPIVLDYFSEHGYRFEVIPEIKAF